MIFRKTCLKSVLGRYFFFSPSFLWEVNTFICLTQNHLASLSICQVSLSGCRASLPSLAHSHHQLLSYRMQSSIQARSSLSKSFQHHPSGADTTSGRSAATLALLTAELSQVTAHSGLEVLDTSKPGLPSGQQVMLLRNSHLQQAAKTWGKSLA